MWDRATGKVILKLVSVETKLSTRALGHRDTSLLWLYSFRERS